MNKQIKTDLFGQEIISNPALQDILDTLKSSNFSGIVKWSDEICTITNIKEFKYTVLQSLLNVASLCSFFQILKKFKVKFRKSMKNIIINFSQVGEKKVYCNKIIECLDEIDSQNERICEKIKKVQDKLQGVIKTNEVVKKYLKNKPCTTKSFEFFSNLIGG